MTTRYKDPYIIATDYDKFVWGYYFYVQEQLDSGAIARKSAVVVSSTSDNGTNWTLPAQGTSVSQDKPNRIVEYVRDNTDLLNATQSTASLAEVLNCDVVVADGNGATLRSAAAAADVSESDLPLIIDTLPTCLYGMTMQTHENALGIPYLQSIIYGKELGINPAYAAAYFYQNFFHITNNQALQETVSTLLESAATSTGFTTSINNYDPQDVESLIIQGINYGIGKYRHDDTSPWNPDMSVGIGGPDSGPFNPRPIPDPVASPPADSGDMISDTVTPTATIYVNPFTDVGSEDWFYDAVAYVNQNGLMTGDSSVTFSPNVPLSRGMAATVLYRLYGSPDVSGISNPFNDVPGNTWYTDAVKWDASVNIISGYGNGSFGPDNYITRQDMAAILNNYVKFTGENLPAVREYQTFNDDAGIAGYAKDAVVRLFQASVVNGMPGNNYNPSGQATRAEFATILVNFLNAMGKLAG